MNRLSRVAAFVLSVTAAAMPSAALRAQASAPTSATLPDRLSDAEFWKLVNDMSEFGGVFPMENWISNEGNLGAIASVIRQRGPHDGVYLGVGPEQNFTYIAAVRPKMAFIVDIRRQAVMQHLMYKALFELSNDRADFISLLFALPRPPRLTVSTPLPQIWTAFQSVAPDVAARQRNLARITAHLTRTHGFTFTSDEQAMLDHVYGRFMEVGPGITFGGRAARGMAGWTVAGPDRDPVLRMTPQLAFINLTLATDPSGALAGFLGTDEAFQFLKQLHAKNLFVPVSGNFAGPKAIRAVGAYVKARGSVISAFYVSSVEVFLFEDGLARQFYDNVATLPTNATSVFIRPTSVGDGTPVSVADPAGGIGTSLCPIAPFLRALATNGFTAGGRGNPQSTFYKALACKP